MTAIELIKGNWDTLKKRFIWSHLILPLAWVFLYEPSSSHLDQGEVINYTSKGILIMIRNKKVSECLSKDPLWIDSFVWNSCGYWISIKGSKIPFWKLIAISGFHCTLMQRKDFNYCIFSIERMPPSEWNGQHTLFLLHTNFGSYLGFLAPHLNGHNGGMKI